jgi:hypothetical protein
MRHTLQSIVISEERILTCCNATFKQASKFVNWKKDPRTHGENHYYHLFDAPSLKWSFDPVPSWLNGAAGGKSYADAVSIQERVCENGLAPKLMINKEYEGALHYAYHLDAGKFAELLKDVATKELGVNHIIANVTHVNQHDNGDIASLTTDIAGQFDGDLFIDCTGFKSLLLGNTLGVKFKDYNHILFTDKAVTIQVPYEDEETPILSHTLSTAQEAGWIWDIGLTNRRGVGYVYSSRHTDDERAEQVLRDYIGNSSQKLKSRTIPIRVGRREQVWKNNCLAIGLSGAFLEPLEASAIFLIEAACYMLADCFPSNRNDMEYVAGNFNRSFAYRWDKVVEFLKLHYVLSGRSDSAFWRDNKNPATVPSALRSKVDYWKNNPPSKYEFNHAYEPFTKESYEFILYGMTTQHNVSPSVSTSCLQKARESFDAVSKAWPEANASLLSNRELLNKIKQYGIKRV